MTTLLIDGWKGNHRRLEGLRRCVATNVRSWGRKDPRPHVRGHGEAAIWSYDSSGRTELETLGAAFAAHLAALAEPFQVVAYSMGGLVLREALRERPDLPLTGAVFLHTPHQGTWMAHAVGLPAVRQMRPGSTFLRRLAAAPWAVPTLAVWCPGDLIVVPGWNARWDRATEEVRYDLPAHIGPIYDSGLHRRIRRFFGQIPAIPRS